MSNTLSMQQPQVSVALSLPSLPLLSRFLTPSLIFWPPGNCLSLVSELLHLSIFLYLWFLHLYARVSGSTTPFAEYPFFLDLVSESAPSFVYLDVSIRSSPTDSFRVDFRDRPLMKLPGSLLESIQCLFSYSSVAVGEAWWQHITCV